ncbi:lichenicidin alpha family lanthipeptide [Streptococcus sp. H31]|uniref:lichenicidin alpha family lanthipeptide n=1 Tax=Streptococcus huangxiaojuni TaxID=3237239 RepID=UPI0034A32CE1
MKAIKNAGLQTELSQLVKLSKELENYSVGADKSWTPFLPGSPVSWYIGNKGWGCTITRECINNCRR